MNPFDALLRSHGIALREARPGTKYAKQRDADLQKVVNRSLKQLSPADLDRLEELFDQAGKPLRGSNGDEVMNLAHGKFDLKKDYFGDQRPMDVVSGKDAKLWKELLKLLKVPGLHRMADRYRLNISRRPGESIHEVHLWSFVFWAPPEKRTLKSTEKQQGTIAEVFWLGEDDFERHIEIGNS